MFLQRLKQLWSRVVSRLAACLHSSSSTEVLGRDGQPAEAAYPHQSAGPGMPSGGFASGHWLDDNRRIRPQLTPSPEGWVARDRQARMSRSLRPDSSSFTSSRSLDGADEHSRPAYEQSAPTTASPKEESASLLPLEPGNGDRVEENSARLDDEETRRRLLGLKYLVRLGIYNEGFAASGTPDQYQHSLGMDEPED
jgi:hypothetical protein